MISMELPPYAPTLIESTRAIGYSLEAAAADIIDNSIAAGASAVDVFFFPMSEAYVAFLDNGCGMNSNEINTAMQYGSKSPLGIRDKQDLGRFGLGLKTASLSQCRMLTVITKQGRELEARRWDIDYVTETGKWSLLILNQEEMKSVPCIKELMKYDSGTLVVWQNLDRLRAGETNFEQSMSRKFDRVRDHLALVYHRYLSGESGIQKLAIAINHTPVVPVDPFLRHKSTQIMDDETLMIRGAKIIVRPYMLPHTSRMTQEELQMLGGNDGLRKMQGFYVYRNKRLLIWGTWFRMIKQDNLSKLARVQVDIPNTLDDLWTLDIKKSSAQPPAEVKKNLQTVIEKLAEQSRRTWTWRGKKEVGTPDFQLWNRMKARDGGVFYEINRKHPLVQQVSQTSPQAGRILDLLLKQIEKGLPINQLYIDLNQDVRVENEQKQPPEEIIAMGKMLLSNMPSEEAKQKLLQSLMMSEPFVNYPDLEKFIKE